MIVSWQYQSLLNNTTGVCTVSGRPRRPLSTFILDRLHEENKPDPWAMTDADIAVYDKAFMKQDKDKDGFISLRGKRVLLEDSAPNFGSSCIFWRGMKTR